MALSLQYFWRDKVGCTADGSAYEGENLLNTGHEKQLPAITIYILLFAGFHFGSQAEIADLHGHVVGKENVTELEVSVNDSLGMEVRQAFNNLLGDCAHFFLAEVLLAPQVLRQTLRVKKMTTFKPRPLKVARQPYITRKKIARI